MEKGSITPKQREILDFIKSELLAKGYFPSVREICNAVHLKSTSSVHSHMKTLEKNGYLRRPPTKPRAIEILDDDFNVFRKDIVNIPIVGTVAAGIPILATENIEGYLSLPTDVLPNTSNNKFFILNVKGDSMINCGILNGDQVIVKQQETALNGEIIVALVDDSATVKRFYREDSYIRLQPENDSMEPIIITPDINISILGKVIGLMRMNIS